MADAKKPAGGDKPAPAKADPFVELVWMFLVLFLAVSALSNLLSFFTNSATFSSGWRGLTPRGLVISHTKPISYLENPMGARFIVSSYYADLFNSPKEIVVDVKRLGDKGYITGGPVLLNIERYWQVEFDDGDFGWISEDDIRYLEKELPWYVRFAVFLWRMIPILKYLLYLFIIALVGFVYYLYTNIVKIRKAEETKYYPNGVMEEMSGATITNPQWEKVLQHSESNNESDWRLAIIEADIMLSELLDKFSLPGETIGDKLKAVEKEDFLTLNQAWEAHKIRNNIAHDGMNFTLTREIVKKTIDNYKAVFEEFNIIEKIPQQ